MKAAAWLLLFLCLGGTFLTAQVQAQEESEAAEDVEDEIEVNEQVDEDADDDAYEEDMDAHEVKSQFLFPDYDDDRLPVGKEVTVLVDFSNEGPDVFNVTGVATFLHSRFDYNYYVQNFTHKAVSGVTGPKAHLSLEFKFTPDASLETVEFILSGVLEYRVENSDEPYQLLFMNKTVELYDDRSSISFSTLSTYMSSLVVLGVVSYLIVTAAAAKGIGKRKKKVDVKKIEAVSEEWEVEAYQERSRSVTKRKKSRR